MNIYYLEVTVRQRRKRAEKDVDDYKYHSYYGSKDFKKKLDKVFMLYIIFKIVSREVCR